MPISDLLAEISGGQPPSTSSAKPAAPSGVKRKAEDGSNGTTSTKLTKARQPDGSYSTSKVTRDGDGRVVERSYSVSRPVKITGPGQAASINSSTLPHRTSTPSTNGRHEPPTPNSQRVGSAPNGKSIATSSSATQSKRTLEASSRPKLDQPASAITKAAPSKLPPAAPMTSDQSRAPKKGSFKEIMARGAKVQEVMGKVGMIQHKPIDKVVIKKERDTSRPDKKSGKGSGVKGKSVTAYAGTSRPSATTGRDNGLTATSARTASRNGLMKDLKTGSKLKSASTASDVAEKKVKKSAIATTGYAGTARPRPGATANKGLSKGDKHPRHGGLLAPPRTNRRSKYEEDYDEDLDDFIEYDDEEEEDMGRRHYDSDGSSDMEAGLSDIDTEEKRAELYAREEDRREHELEERLRREKEARKRRLAQGGR